MMELFKCYYSIDVLQYMPTPIFYLFLNEPTSSFYPFIRYPFIRFCQIPTYTFYGQQNSEKNRGGTTAGT